MHQSKSVVACVSRPFAQKKQISARRSTRKRNPMFLEGWESLEVLVISIVVLFGFLLSSAFSFQHLFVSCTFFWSLEIRFVGRDGHLY